MQRTFCLVNFLADLDGVLADFLALKKVPKKASFCVQNVFDPLLMYFFRPKVLLKDQKMLNLRRMKND